MRKALSFLPSLLLVLTFMPGTVWAQNNILWKQIVGIIPANNVVGSGTGAIPGGFLPWTTTGGSATLNLQSREIHFTVRGLVFAGGSSAITIGTPGPITAVKGALICDNNGSAGGGNSVIVETPSVPLSPTGDASFTGTLDTLPSVCATQPDIAFVVRVSGVNGNPVEGPWIANGAVVFRKGDASAN
jgi:hypothetical protein